MQRYIQPPVNKQSHEKVQYDIKYQMMVNVPVLLAKRTAKYIGKKADAAYIQRNDNSRTGSKVNQFCPQLLREC